MEAGAEEARRIGQSARTLVAVLANTDEWGCWSQARSNLAEADIVQLGDARRRLEERLQPQAIDAYESDLAMRRYEYRHAMLMDTIAELSGNALEAADAFDGVDRMLETTTSDVFGQLAAYIGIESHSSATDLDLLPGPAFNVEYTIGGEAWSNPAKVVWVDDTLIVDAVFIEGVSMRLDVILGATHRVTGTILRGTRDAWRPSSV